VAVFPIRTFGDPVLRTTAAPVTEFDAALERLVEDMVETMYEAPGVGLAAPQIGVSKRVFVFDAGDGPFVMVNPEIVETSGSWSFEEGCLSVPGRFWPIDRPAYVRARGFDLDGDEIEFAGDELLGRVLQHEMDHLEGMLLLERLGRRVRKQALRDLRDEALGMPRSN
jgi:peptide deformylase